MLGAVHGPGAWQLFNLEEMPEGVYLFAIEIIQGHRCLTPLIVRNWRIGTSDCSNSSSRPLFGFTKKSSLAWLLCS